MASSAPKAAQLSLPTKALSMSFVVSLIVKPLAYLGLPSYILHRLSWSSPRTRYYTCNILFACSVGICSSLLVCAAFPLYLLGRRYDVNYYFVHSFCYIFSKLSGLRVVVEGEEHLQRRPYVLLGNHQSMLDLFFSGRCVASPIFPFHGLISPTVRTRWEPEYWPKVHSNMCHSLVNCCKLELQCL
jgi:lysophosphatidate acyltransferase